MQEIAGSDGISAEGLLSGSANLMTEKFHPYLSPNLLLVEAVSSRLELEALPMLARAIIEGLDNEETS